jgi:hypothetical protein
MIERSTERAMSAPIRVSWRGSNRARRAIVFRSRTKQCRLFGTFVGESLEMINAIPGTFHLRRIRPCVVGKGKKTIKFPFFCFISRRIHLRLAIETGRELSELCSNLCACHQTLHIRTTVRRRDF